MDLTVKFYFRISCAPTVVYHYAFVCLIECIRQQLFQDANYEGQDSLAYIKDSTQLLHELEDVCTYVQCNVLKSLLLLWGYFRAVVDVYALYEHIITYLG